MKSIKVRKYLSVAILCVALSFGGFLSEKTVNAATSGGFLIDSSMLDGSEESMRKWQIKYDTGVTMTSGKIVFDADYDTGNPVIAWEKAFSSEEVRNALEISFKISINTITDGKTFGFVYGIPSLMDDVGADGSTYIYFATVNDGIGLGVKTYESGRATDVYPLSELSCDKSNIAVKVIVESDGKLNLSVNNGVVYTSEKPGETQPEGYVGFSSTGNLTSSSKYIDLSVRDVSVFNSYYDKPESPLFSTVNFDAEEFNANEWYINSTKVYGGDGVLMENGALHFKDSGQNSTFTNRFRHSNFEFQFEVFGARNEPKTTSDGRISCASQYLGVNWGLDGDSAEGVGAGYQYESFVYFDAPVDLTFVDDGNGNEVYGEHFGERTGGTRIWFMRQGVGYIERGLPVPEKYGFFNKDFDPETRVKIRIRVIDGVLTVGMKLANELNYTEIYAYTYPLNIVSTGYVSIRGEGNQYVPATYKKYVQGTDFYIDDVTIVNFDKNPNVIDVEYKSNRTVPIPDFMYVDPYTDDYLITATGGKPSKK